MDAAELELICWGVFFLFLGRAGSGGDGRSFDGGEGWVSRERGYAVGW